MKNEQTPLVAEPKLMVNQGADPKLLNSIQREWNKIRSKVQNVNGKVLRKD